MDIKGPLYLSDSIQWTSSGVHSSEKKIGRNGLWMKIWESFCIKYGTFQVLAVASMKMAVFWVVVPCSLVEVYWHFRGACCLHYQDNSSSSPCWWRQQVHLKLWNMGKLLPDYTAQQPRSQPSSSVFKYNACPTLFACLTPSLWVKRKHNNFRIYSVELTQMVDYETPFFI
jgi:hypothetical protein